MRIRRLIVISCIKPPPHVVPDAPLVRERLLLVGIDADAGTVVPKVNFLRRKFERAAFRNVQAGGPFPTTNAQARKNTMLHIRRTVGSVPGLILVTGLSLAACDHSSSNEAATPAVSAAALLSAPSSAPSEPSAAPAEPAQVAAVDDEAPNEELRDYHRHHHHGGIHTFISMAIDTLGLDPAKKAQVEKIQTDLHSKMAPARDAEHDLLSVVADGVRAGKIDAAKVEAAVGKLASASASIHMATTDSLTQLHDALSPVERMALVDKVKAHWEVWHKVNADEKLGSKEKGTHLARLAELLSLTSDQVDAITKALSADSPTTTQTDPKPVDAHVQAFATAFVADRTNSTRNRWQRPPLRRRVISRGTGGRSWRASMRAITPVLTPDQRTKLADHLQERLNDQHAASGK